MKSILTFIIFFLTLNAMSSDYQIKSVELGAMDENNRKTLCVLVIEIEGEELGIIEDITDCYYTRKYKPFVGQKLELELPFDRMIAPSSALTHHLPRRTYLFSDFD
jgi:hypothetical protein